jgi:O-antigen/teichoic acid export membrane protein
MVNVGVNLWSIPTFGITGAAWTTLATEALNVALLLWFVISRGLVPPPRLPAVRIGLAATGLAGIAHGLGGWPVELAGLIALASYVVVLIASGVLRGAELARLRRLMRADSPRP